MKILPLLQSALLICAATSNLVCATPAFAVPAKAAGTTNPTIPAEVRALMAAGATTVELVPLRLGNSGSPLLLHCWKMARSSPERAPKLFCLDLFTRDPDNPQKWQLASSISYQGQGSAFLCPEAISYETRCLQPDQKRGLVIVEKTPESSDILFRLITLPDWKGDRPGESRILRYDVQEFFADFAGPVTSSIDFGFDKNGKMTVEEVVTPHAAVPAIRNIYAWNGAGWMKVAGKPIKPQAK